MNKPNLILNKYLLKNTVKTKVNYFNLVLFMSFISFLLLSLFYKYKDKPSKTQKKNTIIKFYNDVYSL